MMRKLVQGGAAGLGVGIFAVCAEFVRGSFIVGSKCAFFSGASTVAPLAGAYGGTAALISMHILRLLIMQTPHIPSSWSSLALAYHIPTICAGLYWSWMVYNPYKRYWAARIVMAALPLLCMALFMADSTGNSAWQYTLFWLIPAASALISHNSILFHALSSTFIAHAVGSVLWVWTHPMPASMWLALIPVVVFERAAMALGMVCAMVLIDYGTEYAGTLARGIWWVSRHIRLLIAS